MTRKDPGQGIEGPMGEIRRTRKDPSEVGGPGGSKDLEGRTQGRVRRIRTMDLNVPEGPGRGSKEIRRTRKDPRERSKDWGRRI